MKASSRTCVIPRVFGGVVFAVHGSLLYLLLDWPFGPSAPAANPMLMLLGFTLGAYPLAFKWPLHGGVLATIGALSMSAIHLGSSGSENAGVLAAIVVVPQLLVGGLFLICWWRTK